MGRDGRVDAISARELGLIDVVQGMEMAATIGENLRVFVIAGRAGRTTLCQGDVLVRTS